MWNQTKVQGVIFDMDGVLVDTSPCHSHAYAKLWKSLGIQGPAYPVIAGRSTKDVVAEYAAQLTEQQQYKAVKYKQAAALKLLETANVGFNDTRKALETLKSMGCPMAIATSASKASADLVLRRLDIAHFFDVVITSEDVMRAKPAPDLFLAAIRALELQGENAIILEDSRSGIEAALATGGNVVSVREADLLPDVMTSRTTYLGHFATVLDVIQKIAEHTPHHRQDSLVQQQEGKA